MKGLIDLNIGFNFYSITEKLCVYTLKQLTVKPDLKHLFTMRQRRLIDVDIILNSACQHISLELLFLCNLNIY